MSYDHALGDALSHRKSALIRSVAEDYEHEAQRAQHPDASALTSWRKSGYSGGSSGDCLEVADAARPFVPVRDSKNPTGPAIVFSIPARQSFVTSLGRTTP
ncbi:DUF397 domain-containing protein [Streptomyces canus]|uniref:DUF397 domain-containing protein n=1 Tax=Streptomyces canus TaxID=58343 RepID=UPI00386633F0